MSLKTHVKVGGILHLNEARYCSGMGVDIIGFPLGEGHLSLALFEEITGWIEGPKFVAELTHSKSIDQKFVDLVLQLPKVEYIELYFHQLLILSQRGPITKPVILSTNSEEWKQISDTLGKFPISYVMIKKLEEESDETYWECVESIHATFPVLTLGPSASEKSYHRIFKDKKKLPGIAFYVSYFSTARGKEATESLYEVLEMLTSE